MNRGQVLQGMRLWDTSNLKNQKPMMISRLKECMDKADIGEEYDALSFLCWCVNRLPDILAELTTLSVHDKVQVFESTPPPVGYPATDELDKMQRITHISQQIDEFLGWLRDEKDVYFAQTTEAGEPALFVEMGSVSDDGSGLNPYCMDKAQVLAEYFDIDLNKVEHERRNILRWLQEKHQGKSVEFSKTRDHLDIKVSTDKEMGTVDEE